jgi:ATP-binding cassette subfamily B protein
LRQVLYSHVQKLSLAYHDRKQTGDLISRVTSDIDSIQSFITSGLLGVLVDSMTLIGMVCVMFYINWRFTLIALSVAPVLFLVVYSYTRRIKKASREVRKKEGEIVSVIEEVLSSIRVVKAFAREDYELRRLEEESLENVEIALRARSLKAKLLPLVEVIVAVGTCLVLWFGVRMVLADNLSSGSLIVFILYLGKMYKPMQDLSKMADSYSKASVGFERIREVLDTDHEVKDLPGARPAQHFKGKIEFEHVGFSYIPDHPVLHNISVRVDQGQVAALVGPTGAGKTTIISLIPRFYEAGSGRVSIDGRDVREMTVKSLRRHIGMVLQDPVLFSGSVRENILYGRPDATEGQVLEASRAAHAYDFIQDLPQGFDTEVGERGSFLSGGQRQRITIARAFLKDPRILILDEATANLDPDSEHLIQAAMKRLVLGRTTFIIAHRLSTVLHAERILVLSAGRVVESGTHHELLAHGGLYRNYHQKQFASAEAG